MYGVQVDALTIAAMNSIQQKETILDPLLEHQGLSSKLAPSRNQLIFGLRQQPFTAVGWEKQSKPKVRQTNKLLTLFYIV